MGNYAVEDDVRDRLPGRTIDGSSAPTQTTVGEWIDQAEAIIDGELVGAGVTSSVPVTASRGVSILKDLVAERTAGLVERAWASGTNLEGDDVGGDRIQKFEDFVALIRRDSERVATMLGISTSSVSKFKSLPTDDPDGGTISGGDFEPEFDRDTEF